MRRPLRGLFRALQAEVLPGGPFHIVRTCCTICVTDKLVVPACSGERLAVGAQNVEMWKVLSSPAWKH